MRNSETAKAKDLIADALAVIISEKNIRDITVAELTKAAGVSKSSFYRNFHDIYEVFEYLSDGFVNRASEVMFSFLFDFSPTVVRMIPDDIDWQSIISLFAFTPADEAVVNYLFNIKDAKVFRSVVKLVVDKVVSYGKEHKLDIELVEFCTRFIANGIYYFFLNDYISKDKFNRDLLELVMSFDINELKAEV